MRAAPSLLAACLLLAACGRGNREADRLDRAAAQSGPAAAAVLRNEADALRDNGTDATLADPNGPAQQALEAAGNAAADHSGQTAIRRRDMATDPVTGLTRR